jgi:hypothetical protein
MKYKQILVTALGLICSACMFHTPAIDEEVAVRPPLLITHQQKAATTSTGGVGHNLGFVNPSAHTYQQIAFVFIPYDRFGRRQSSDIDDVDEIQISLPDPVVPGQAMTQFWPDIWFSHQISCVELDRLRIVYADGRAQVFRKPDVDRMLAPGVGNDCRN